MTQTDQTIAEDLLVGMHLQRIDTAGKTQYRIRRICTDGSVHTIYQVTDVHEVLEEYLRERGAAYRDMVRALIPDDFRKKWPH